MKLLMEKTGIYYLLLVILAAGLLWSCGSSAPTPVTKPPTTDKPSAPPVASPPSDKPSATANRVDIVYFHPKIRCGSCLSVELRTKDVVDSFFKEAVDSGKLTFQSYELQDTQNASMVKKYGAVGSQLFITTVKNGNEGIRHVQEVWMPQLLNDGVAFDDFMQDLISQSLQEVS